MIDLALMAGYADAARSIEYSAMAGFFAPGSNLDPDLEAYFSSFSVVISYLFDPDDFFVGNLERAGVETVVRCPYKIDESGEHASRQLAAPLEELAMWLDDAAAVIPGAELHRDLVAWHPGSGSPKKNWSPEKWADVFVKLGIDELLLISGEAEEERMAEIESALESRGVRFTSARGVGFEDLCTQLRRVRVFFGHDSGIAHLAAACGAPCVLVFGPTDPDVWAPANEGVLVVRAPDGELERLEVEDVVALVETRGLL